MARVPTRPPAQRCRRLAVALAGPRLGPPPTRSTATPRSPAPAGLDIAVVRLLADVSPDPGFGDDRVAFTEGSGDQLTSNVAHARSFVPDSVENVLHKV